VKSPADQTPWVGSHPGKGTGETERSLLEALQHGFPHLKPSEKRRRIAELGRTVRRWHDAGDYVADFADIRVREEEGGWVFLSAASPSGRRQCFPHAQHRRIVALGGLLADCWLDTSRSERERFLTAYALPGHKPGPRQRRRIEAVAWRKLRIGWRDRVKKCFGDNEGFVAGCRGGFRYHGAGERADSALDALLPDPDLVLAQGRIYKPGTRTHAGRITIAGTYRFLKRINYRGWRYGMKYLFRRSRALHNWQVMWAFRFRRVPVADPILCLEERRFRFLKRSYVLTDFSRDAERMKVVWPDLTDVQRKTLLIRLAGILGRMHRFGCLHGDLKWDNILVCARDGRVTLVDFDGSRILRRPTAKRANKDIARFLKDLKGGDGSGRWTRLFFNSWKKWIIGM